MIEKQHQSIPTSVNCWQFQAVGVDNNIIMSFGAPGILPSAASQDQEAAAPTESAAKREDWRKAKELDEARKAGTAPALVDEEGK